MSKMNKKYVEDLCIYCEKKMHKSFVRYKGLELEAKECPKCHRRVFSEEQTLKAIEQIEEKELKEKYMKHPVKIGNSWGVIFPNEVSKKFQLNDKKTELIIHPMLSKKIIELQIE